MTKDELVQKNAALEAEVEALRSTVKTLRQQISYADERHEVASMLLGDAIINNRVMAEMQTQPAPPSHGHGAPELTPVEAKELGLS